MAHSALPAERETLSISLTGSIDRVAHTPAYEQLKQIVRTTLAKNEVAPGSRLPSVAEFCAQFAVSRLTVTKALDELEHEGLITRVQGRGNFAIGKPIPILQYGLLGFSRSMEQQGLQTRSRVLSIETIPATESINCAFRRDPQARERYTAIRRLRLVDDQPVVITTSIVPESLGRQMRSLPLEDVSFYALFGKITGKSVAHESLVVRLVRVNRQEAGLLGVGDGSAHFLTEGICYLEGDIPIENSHNIFHGDRFSFALNFAKH